MRRIAVNLAGCVLLANFWITSQAQAQAAAADPAPVASAHVETQPSRLDLICFGGGSANKVTVTNGYGYGTSSGTFQGSNGSFGTYSGSGSASATVYGQRSQGFEDQVSLFIEGDQGRVRMPRTMLPPIHGGDDGWFKLKNVKFKDNEISASVAVNVMNNPKLRVDRYTGAISISGKAGDYAGRCEKADPQQAKRQF
ncbi:hypothetical protein ACFFF7_02575 [Novosphingobium aquiterrae]|uniref:Secreted protein n=1 Tax=Novosphingobium aquiterrae TaxID=624388 RepID=A0ABV6PEN7_9SPHN